MFTKQLNELQNALHVKSSQRVTKQFSPVGFSQDKL